MTELVNFSFEENLQKLCAQERDAAMQNPGFGRVFTDYMVTIKYSQGYGWHDAKIEPRKPLRKS